MTSRERPDPRDLWARGSPSIRNPRVSRDPQETNASILYTLLVSNGLLVVGVAGLVGEPDLPRGAIGELLRDLLLVDPARDALRAVVGLAGVVAMFAQRSSAYCLAVGILFTMLGALGLLLDVWGVGALPGFSSIGPIASMSYLALGALGLWCGLARQFTRRKRERAGASS